MNLGVAFIRPFVYFPLSLIFTILSYIIIAGKYSATMHEEHACKLHKAPTHHPRGLHIRWQRVLDTTGRAIGNCSQYRPQQSTSLHQDGTYSFAEFTTAFEEYDVQRVIRSYENSISISVHCCQEGDWSQVMFKLNFHEGFKGHLCSPSYALCPHTKCFYCSPRLCHSERG